MTGKAFDLGEKQFSRISSSEYASLERRFSGQLRSLYTDVITPVIAPWKPEHASVYFLVKGPLKADAQNDLKATLGAQYEARDVGSVSLFAIPTGAADKFYKVEVHECQTRSDLECAKLHLSYADLGMILSVLARANGFILGTRGLKTHYANPEDERISGYVLSDSPEHILKFFGLSVDAYRRGFRSQEEVFAWVKASRFYNPAQFIATSEKSTKKVDPQFREMFCAFLTSASAEQSSRHNPDIDTTRNEAVRFFGKQADYEILVKQNKLSRARREKFNGKLVMDWTKLYGPDIHYIMEDVVNKIGEEGLLSYSTEQLKSEVLKVQKNHEGKHPIVKKKRTPSQAQ